MHLSGAFKSITPQQPRTEAGMLMQRLVDLIASQQEIIAVLINRIDALESRP